MAKRDVKRGRKGRAGRAESQRSPGRARRALSNVGGKVERVGDPVICELLATAARPPKEADSRALTHGFHAWPARLHPHTARTLIAASPAGVVCDPFMGGGTCAVEALLASRPCSASDLNPLAVEVAWARTRRWPDYLLATLVKRAQATVARAQRLRQNRGVDPDFSRAEGQWYDPPALGEVWGLAAALRGSDDRLDRMLRVCLSSILVKVSRQASDSVVRHDRDHRYVGRGQVERQFVQRVQEHAENLAALLQRVSADAPEPVLSIADARDPPPVEGVAAVITSPPYPGVYDYVGHHSRRYAALGLDASAMARGEIGSRRAQRRDRPGGVATRAYAKSMAEAVAVWPARLAKGGRIYLVVGDGQRADGAIDVVPIMGGVAAATGLSIVARISQARPTFSVGRQGRPAARRKEHIFALGKET